MSLVVGLAIDRDALRAVGVRRSRIVWGVEAPLVDDAGLADSLGVFLGRLPLGRFGRPRVMVALGPAFAQAKRLTGLPPINDERLLSRTVSEHSARFFLKNGVPLVMTSVRLDEQGNAWGAALQKNVVDAIVMACRASRLRLEGVVPGVCVAKSDVAALASLGSGAPAFAAAYGATANGNTIVWRASGLMDERPPRWRFLMAAGLSGATLVLAVIAPGVSARAAEHGATEHLASLASLTGAARRVGRDNDLVTRALGEVVAFDRDRRPVTTTLGAVARALPDSAAILAFHLDSAGGSITALAASAGTLMRRIETVPGAAGVEIAGPVTRASVGGRQFERVMVRFRWRDK